MLRARTYKEDALQNITTLNKIILDFYLVF
jgi:hypothetical protein